MVAKPVVGTGAFLTERITDPALARAGEFWRTLCTDREVMVQPYLASVETYGERSLIWIDGELTHAIRKSPRLGDAPESVSDALPIAHIERELAEAVIADIPHELLYARIDLVRDDDDRVAAGRTGTGRAGLVPAPGTGRAQATGARHLRTAPEPQVKAKANQPIAITRLSARAPTAAAPAPRRRARTASQTPIQLGRPQTKPYHAGR